MFVLGGLPARLVIPLRMQLVESPRWLASRGRFAEADAAMQRIEAVVSDGGRQPLPPLPEHIAPLPVASTRLGDLFRGIYLRRTLSLWGLWITSYMVIYGLGGWFISIMRTVYKLSQVQSLWYGVVLNLLTLLGTLACVFLVDRIGRKPLFTSAFFLGSLPLLALAAMGPEDPQTVLTLASMSACCLGVLAVGLGMFTAENYPNQLRALGGGIANGWLRAASVVTPAIIGQMVATSGVGPVWGLLGGAALLGALICALFSIETSGRTLEELSPSR
jgi:putative MFS transporter